MHSNLQIEPSRKSLKILVLSLFLIVILNSIGLLEGWYWEFWWYDIPMHILGGAWVAMLFFYIFTERHPVAGLEKNRLITFVFALGFVALVAVSWELYEYLIDTFVIKKHTLLGAGQSVADTLGDLVNAFIGAAVVAATGSHFFKKST